MRAKIRQWFKTSFLFHAGFWLTYILVSAIGDLPYHQVIHQNLSTHFIIACSMMGLIYFNLYYLIPRLLLAKRYFTYTLSILVLMIANTFFVSWILTQMATVFYAELAGILVLFTDCFLLVAITSFVKMVQSLYQKEKYAKELEKKHLETELNYLKAQINPHFLFNTLNSIYFSIRKRPELAQEIVLQFSDILSHQLYDASKNKLPLEKEFNYLKRYIDLEKIRQGEIVQVNYSFPEKANHYQVIPMILLPFVENAFKHGQRTTLDGYWINIKAELIEHTLHFEVENNYRPDHHTHTYSGIGLKNVKRRLALAYPERHQLQINTYTQALNVLASIGEEQPPGEEHIFQVHLEVDLSEQDI